MENKEKFTVSEMTEMLENRNDNGSWFYVQPDDWTGLCKTVEKVKERMPKKYVEHLVGFEKDGSNTFKPLFDDEHQKMWNKEQSDYIKHKAEWCQKYGCD